MSIVASIRDADGDECITTVLAVRATADTIEIETDSAVLSIPRSDDYRLGCVQVWTGASMVRTWPIDGKKICPKS